MSAVKSWLRSVAWVSLNYAATRRCIRRHLPIRSLWPIQCSRWHRGNRYFYALLADGHRLFIKTDNDSGLLEPELKALGILRERVDRLDWTPVLAASALGTDCRFAAFEWVRNVKLREAIGTHSFRPFLAELACQLVKLVDGLAAAGLVHRDLTPDNLLVELDEAGRPVRLLIVDFAFSAVDGESAADGLSPAGDLAVLCSGYSPGPSVWDDAFSSLMILREIEGELGTRLDGVRSALEGRIGRCVHQARAQPVTSKV